MKIPETTTAAARVAIGLIRNMATMQPIAPASEKAQCTRNFGRKEGLARKRSIPAARLSAPYVVRKNMVSTGAMMFRFPR